MIDYIAAIAAESGRFSELIRGLDADTTVPSCPDWSVDDLAWHLTEVQYFWATIAGRLLRSPDGVEELARPDRTQLPAVFDAQSRLLVAALASHQPDARCWSWHDAGQNIGWVRRRQAHEALIHRVDVELTAGRPTRIDDDLATDGIDEILRVMLDASSLPAWGSFDADGRTATISADGGATWSMQLGRFTGTSPTTGNAYDDPALVLAPVEGSPTVTVSGTGPQLDLWLWGRGPIDVLRVEGSTEAAIDIRAAAAAGTQ